MTSAKLSGWIAFLLCLCMFSIFGCSESEQGATYKKAQAALDRRSDMAKYKDAAMLFESAGDFKDAAKRGNECWYTYGVFRLRFEGKNPQETLVSLLEAKSVFEHIHDYKFVAERTAEADAAIVVTQAWIAVQTELDNGNDSNAIALLEAMDPKNKKVQDTLEFVRTKDERSKGFTLLQTYLKGVPQSTFVPDEKLLLYANLDRLFMSDGFKGNQEKIADALASLRCYEIIAQGWNKTLGYANERKLSYKGASLETPLTNTTLLMATIQLAEAGDESAEFAELLALLRSIVISPKGNRYNDELRRYAKLLELYNAEAELANKCFPLIDLQHCNTPGTMDYRVLHAPQRIKDVLYNERTDVLGDRFTRAYSPQEANALFSNFVPNKPLKTGFTVIIDRGSPPPHTSDGQIFNYLAYESAPKYITASYERQNKPSQKPVYGSQKSILVKPPQESPLIEERIPQKGEFFCVANPNNARLAIYETYSYIRHSSYRVSGRQEMVDVYLPVLYISVVDIVAQKTLFTDRISADAEQTYRVPVNIKQGDAYIPGLFLIVQATWRKNCAVFSNRVSSLLKFLLSR